MPVERLSQVGRAGRVGWVDRVRQVGQAGRISRVGQLSLVDRVVWVGHVAWEAGYAEWGAFAGSCQASLHFLRFCTIYMVFVSFHMVSMIYYCRMICYRVHLISYAFLITYYDWYVFNMVLLFSVWFLYDSVRLAEAGWPECLADFADFKLHQWAY